MSIWSRLIGIKKTEDTNNVIGNKTTSVPYDTSHYNYTIIDIEVSLKEHKIHDIGALRYDGAAIIKLRKKNYLNLLMRQTISAATTLFIMMLSICSQTKHAVGF